MAYGMYYLYLSILIQFLTVRTDYSLAMILSIRADNVDPDQMSIHARSPAGEKSHGISNNLMVSRILKKLIFFYFRYIWFILRPCGRFYGWL